MKDISIGLEFAWQIAAVEAAYGRYEFIEPEHLFIGLCKIASISQLADWGNPELPENLANAFKAESEALAALFAVFQLDHVTLYRNVRRRKGQSDFEHKQKKISRSSASRAVFDRAKDLAKDSMAVNLLHLLASLLDVSG
jgi:hypothetical protein